MGKHSAPSGRGGSIPDSELVGDYQPVSVPTSGGCCENSGDLESKVDQIDRAYGDDK